MTTPPPLTLAPSTFYSFLAAFALLGYLTCRGLEFAITRYYRMIRPLVGWIDGDSLTVKFQRVKRKDSIVTRGRGNDERDYPLQGGARLQSNYGSLWLVHARHGFNLVPQPSAPDGLNVVPAPDKETVHKDRMLGWLAIVNPAHLAFHARAQLTRQTLEANRSDDGWLVKVAPFAFIAILATLAVVSYIAYLLIQISGKSAAAATGGG